jgi:energy-coupling factor transporter ATP-binding protein EcfA2
MPRVIPTVWFGTLSFWHEPIFRVGNLGLTPRQVLLALPIGLLSLLLVLALPLPTVPRIFGTLLFAIGTGYFFLPEGKILPREKHLLLVLAGRRKRGARQTEGKTEGEAAPAPSPVTLKEIEVPAGERVTVTGTLTDRATGRPLVKWPYTVTLDGRPYDSGVTGPEGGYTVVVFPDTVGIHEVAVKPEGGEEEKVRIYAGVPLPKPPPKKGGERSPSLPASSAETGGYVYELEPENFITLSDEEQDKAVDRFRAFLNSLEGEVEIVALRTQLSVKMGENEVTVQPYRFYIVSQKPIDPQLQVWGVGFHRVGGVPRPQPSGQLRDSLVLQGGKEVQVLQIYALPPTLVEGFLVGLYGSVEEVRTRIRPIPHDRAVRKTERTLRQLQGQVIAMGARGRAIPEELRLALENAQALHSAVMAGGSRLFEMNISIVVPVAALKEVVSKLGGEMVRVDTLPWLQRQMYEGDERTLKWLVVGTETAGCTYPFASADVVEEGGILLGVNMNTGAPVIFNFQRRENQNCTVIGTTGAGKSFALKLMATRLAERNPGLHIYVIDPENEYWRALQPLGVKRIDVGGQNLGLDPLKLFPDDKTTAAGIVEQILRLEPESDEAFAVRELVAVCSSMEELWRKAPAKLKRRIKSVLRGPEGFLIAGKTVSIGKRTIFNLRELHKPTYAHGRFSTLNLAALLIFTRIWKEIERLPLHVPKLVIVDEAWLYTSVPASAAFLEQAARRSRKLNTILLVATQKAKDVLENEVGRTICEMSATTFLLRQETVAVKHVCDVFELTEPEGEALRDFDPGQALLRARGIRVPIAFWSSPEEYALFTTKPEEV